MYGLRRHSIYDNINILKIPYVVKNSEWNVHFRQIRTEFLKLNLTNRQIF
ncbi:hypothetical protein P4T34_07395 [Bacillus mobilis]|nr:hypothetical protein [Bacillus mobilis]MED0995327.1 hypothetical protein [Bacillus mobilis]MED1001313.1 hypothetical protein [Bacillus mobilis]